MSGAKGRALAIAVVGLWVAQFVIHGAEQDSPSNDEPMNHILLKNGIRDPSHVYPESAKCTKIDFEGKSFAVYLYDLPSYGISRTEVDGWVFRQDQKIWDCLFSTRIYAVGRSELAFDEKNGSLSLTGRADNKFKGVKVFTFDLRVATP